jgi:enolase-phosphatase E1
VRSIEQLRAERLKEQIGSDAPEWVDLPNARADSAADYAEWLMSRDSKSPALKELQGFVWKHGYASGVLRGDVFADVPRAFAAWKRDGIRVAIYSSGSVLAQRLIFGSTQFGDLTPGISGWFDTAVGPKRESESYRTIARSLGTGASSILFLSDVGAELRAAAEVGFRVGLVVRPGNPAQESGGWTVVRSLDEVRA